LAPAVGVGAYAAFTGAPVDEISVDVKCAYSASSANPNFGPPAGYGPAEMSDAYRLTDLNDPRQPALILLQESPQDYGGYRHFIDDLHFEGGSQHLDSFKSQLSIVHADGSVVLAGGQGGNTTFDGIPPRCIAPTRTPSDAFLGYFLIDVGGGSIATVIHLQQKALKTMRIRTSVAEIEAHLADPGSIDDGLLTSTLTMLADPSLDASDDLTSTRNAIDRIRSVAQQERSYAEAYRLLTQAKSISNVDDSIALAVQAQNEFAQASGYGNADELKNLSAQVESDARQRKAEQIAALERAREAAAAKARAQFLAKEQQQKREEVAAEVQAAPFIPLIRAWSADPHDNLAGAWRSVRSDAPVIFIVFQKNGTAVLGLRDMTSALGAYGGRYAADGCRMVFFPLPSVYPAGVPRFDFSSGVISLEAVLPFDMTMTGGELDLKQGNTQKVSVLVRTDIGHIQALMIRESGGI
jgi:hypothetical protein